MIFKEGHGVRSCSVHRGANKAPSCPEASVDHFQQLRGDGEDVDNLVNLSPTKKKKGPLPAIRSSGIFKV